MRIRSAVAFVAMTLFHSFSAMAQQVDFQHHILPILKAHCLDCHGRNNPEGRLRLDSMPGALQGGNSGEPTVVPGHSDRSYLIELVSHHDSEKRMPLGSDPLSEAEINLLRAWIDNAAEWENAQQAIAGRKTSHWSFQPLLRPELPRTEAASAIDSFVIKKLNDVGLKMSMPASRRRRIRRLYLVMHGLPPTSREVTDFVNDQRPDAWNRLVDKVLSSPRYGERWAQHWLDLVRFGETNGYETNRERPNAWPFRDWVIEAFNSDKPYDQFVIEQIAGDAVGADIGTAFLVAGPVDIVKGKDKQLQLTQRQDELADIINATSTAFLGLTVGCARCHNHKFDAITQTDYYAMQSVFSGVKHGERGLPLSEQTQKEVNALKVQIAASEERLKKFISRDTLRPAVTAKLNVESFQAIEARYVRFTINQTNQSQPCIDELEIFAGNTNVALASAGARPSSSGDFVHPLHKLEHINDGIYGNANSWISSQVKGGWVQIELPKRMQVDRIVWARDRMQKYGDRLATDYKIEVSANGITWKTVASSQDRVPFQNHNTTGPQYDFASFAKSEADAGRKTLAELRAMKARRAAMTKTRIVYAGNFSTPPATYRLYRGEPGSPREQVAPAGIASLDGIRLAEDSSEQSRRLEIAKWIASAKNPLTSRVMVNRLWQFHFGAGIVDTPSDFGTNGTLPSHPELLDWLAAEFISGNWSTKHIHRLILTSNTWQQDSQPVSDGIRVDALCRLLWRFPPRRLEAEAIHDCILATSGKLNLKMGGPGFSAFEVELENVRHYFPKRTYGPEDWRRMVYMTKVRQERDAVFGVFDCPDGSQVTPKRSRSTTPLQALNLLNSRFVMQQAEFFAERLKSEYESPGDRIGRAYELCFGRLPELDEVSAAESFIQAYGWTQFARAMLNANEFVFIP